MKKNERLRLYEGMYILNATLSEDARKKALEKITQSIIEKGGEIHKIHERGRQRFAYEINRKREGFYYVIYFSLGSTLVSELWKEYHLHEDLIRYLTLSAEEVRETLEFQPLKLV
ncbi:MAG: 30S ribosomal protein S6 [Chlamydiota bacterium]